MTFSDLQQQNIALSQIKFVDYDFFIFICTTILEMVPQIHYGFKLNLNPQISCECCAEQSTILIC